MKIINYPHPTLRHKSRAIRRVDSALKKNIAEMFDLMYEAKGIGLAANQVDLPLQLFIVNLSGEKGEGEELVFINPVLSHPRGQSEKEEGCLSLPGVHFDVVRPESIHVKAYDLAGTAIDQRFDGMLARVIQHENDHLEGVLFIDRLSEQDVRLLDGELKALENELRNNQIRGLVPDDKGIEKRLAEIEQQYCEAAQTGN